MTDQMIIFSKVQVMLGCVGSSWRITRVELGEVLALVCARLASDGKIFLKFLSRHWVLGSLFKSLLAIASPLLPPFPSLLTYHICDNIR